MTQFVTGIVRQQACMMTDGRVRTGRSLEQAEAVPVERVRAPFRDKKQARWAPWTRSECVWTNRTSRPADAAEDRARTLPSAWKSGLSGSSISMADKWPLLAVGVDDVIVGGNGSRGRDSVCDLRTGQVRSWPPVRAAMAAFHSG